MLHQFIWKSVKSKNKDLLFNKLHINWCDFFIYQLSYYLYCPKALAIYFLQKWIQLVKVMNEIKEKEIKEKE